MASSSDSSQTKSELLRRFGGLAKKIWNPRLFKAQVSPHEFLQEVSRVSGGKFKITEQGDPVEFLGWLLNQLHKDMGGSRKRNSCECASGSPETVSPVTVLIIPSCLAIIYQSFQGELRMETQQVVMKGDDEGHARPVFDINQGVNESLFTATASRLSRSAL